MKRSKRILAVLLTVVLTLTLLAGCGGGGNGTYTVSATVKSSVTSTLQKAGFTASPDEKALDAVSAAYAAQIAKSPKSYSVASGGSSLTSLQSKWSDACKNAFTTSRKQSIWASSSCVGGTSEAAAASYYAGSISNLISQFNEFTSGTTGTAYYYVYPVYAVSSTDPENSVWVMFTILYLS